MDNLHSGTVRRMLSTMKGEPVLAAIYALIVAGRAMSSRRRTRPAPAESTAIDGFVLAGLGLGLAVRSRVTPHPPKPATKNRRPRAKQAKTESEGTP